VESIPWKPWETLKNPWIFFAPGKPLNYNPPLKNYVLKQISWAVVGAQCFMDLFLINPLNSPEN